MKISVIIPVYNCAKFLRKAVESALNQDETEEVILVEDCSPDNALELCQRLENKYHKIKLCQHPDKKNHGAGASRNLGIEKAQYKYIAFLDGDDYYLPNRFKKTKEVFEKYDDCDGVYECLDSKFLDKEGKLRFDSKLFITTLKKEVAPKKLLEEMVFNDIGYFHLDCLCVKKEIFKSLNFDEELKLHQDTYFTYLLAASRNLYPGNIASPVAIRGIHKANRYTHDTGLTHYRKMLLDKMLEKSIEMNLEDEKIYLFWWLKIKLTCYYNQFSAILSIIYQIKHQVKFTFKNPNYLKKSCFYKTLPIVRSLLRAFNNYYS